MELSFLVLRYVLSGALMGAAGYIFLKAVSALWHVPIRDVTTVTRRKLALFIMPKNPDLHDAVAEVIWEEIRDELYKMRFSILHNNTWEEVKRATHVDMETKLLDVASKTVACVMMKRNIYK